MENETETRVRSKNVHHGHNVRRLRLDQKLSQKELGQRIGMTQTTVCSYENKEQIDEEILMRFAKGLDVSLELLKELEDDKSISYYIENNTFSDNDNNVIGSGNSNSPTIHNDRDENVSAFLAQLSKLCEDNRNLYEENRQLYQRTIKLYESNMESALERIKNLEEKITGKVNS